MADARVDAASRLPCWPWCSAWSGAPRSPSSSWRCATPPAEVFAALRALAAAPALFAALLIQDAAGLGRALRDRRVHVVGLVVGASLVAGFLALSTVGLEYAGIGFGVVLIYSQPLLVAGLAALVLGGDWARARSSALRRLGRHCARRPR